MRTLVDLPDKDLRELTELGKRSKTVAGLAYSRGRRGLSRAHAEEQARPTLRPVGAERSGRPRPPEEDPRRMVKALFDTNILIDFLRGIPAAREELGRYRQKAISLVTWMEVLVGASPATERGTREFLNGFELIAIDHGIAERAVALRKAHRCQIARRNRVGLRAGACDVACDSRCQGISRLGIPPSECHTLEPCWRRLTRPSHSYAAPPPADHAGGR